MSVIIAIAFAFHLSAKSISPQAALERAMHSELMQSTDMRRVSSAAAGMEYTLAYSAPSGAYYVFNRLSGGYVVVSGDDDTAPLLADVTSGEFSAGEMAPAAAWILSGYDSEIQSQTTSGMPDSWLMDQYAVWTDIAPMMSTKWGQTYPYNIHCPAINGSACVTGCVATAMAQVVHAIGYYKGSGIRSYNGVNTHGEPVVFDFASADFDFDSMFDVYTPSVSQESIDQVGRLMLACGLSSAIGYGLTESGGSNSEMARALVEHFGYDSDYTRLYSHRDFSQSQWENMIYSQLSLGRPVYYAGSTKTSGHAFVIDGYRRSGMYHVNWGWDGMSDGWFRLSALNPSHTGTGGALGGYNAAQHMVCAVPPGADPGVVYGKMGGSMSVAGDSRLALYYKSKGYTLFNVGVGAVIVGPDGGRVAETTFWSGQNLTMSGAVRHDSFSCDFSGCGLLPGDYRIYPAYVCDDGLGYVVADMIYGRPYFVCLTVTDDGRYVLSDSPAAVAETDIRVVDILPDHDLHSGFSGEFSFYVVNDGDLDYEGCITVVFSDISGRELCSTKSDEISVAARTNTVVDCGFPVFDSSDALIQPGICLVRFYDEDGNQLSDEELSVEIKGGAPLSKWTRYETLEVTNGLSVPPVLVGGQLWPHTPVINTQNTHRSASLNIAFYAPSGTTSSHTFECFRGTIEPMADVLPIDPVYADVPFGVYEVCYRKGYTQISLRRPVRVGVLAGGLVFLPSLDNGVSVIEAPECGATADIVVPDRITIGDTQLSVTGIDSEAFAWNQSLSVVELPSSINRIGANAFTGCVSLRQIIMHPADPPFALRNYIAQGIGYSTEFYVPAESYDRYSPLLEPYNPVYALVEKIESKDVSLTQGSVSAVSLSISPAHEAVNPAFVVSAADEASESVADVRIVTSEPGRLEIEVSARNSGEATFHIRPAHRGGDYAVLNVSVAETTSISGVETETGPVSEETVACDLLGRPVDQQKTVPQIRIVRDATGKTAKILK